MISPLLSLLAIGLPPTVEALRYIGLGFLHILPGGYDHMLFVLGLLLVTQNTRSLLSQVTLFTLGHTITFGLGLLGWVQMSPVAVEIGIALSLSFVAVENLLRRKDNPWRPVVALAFGLLHGLGFAHSLQEIHVPSHSFWQALLGFNLGVEAGQLTFVILTYAALSSFHQHPWYRQRVTIPVSACIAIAGLVLAIHRIG